MLGLVAAAPAGRPDDLLAAALELEPHADNVAAALVGGVTLVCDGRITRIASTLPLAPVAVIPESRVRTQLSREALPATVPHSDAALTAGHAAMLGAAVASADPDLFTRALVDRLHEPYRPSAVLDSVRGELPPGARGATLSGSGPTVIVWADEPAACAVALTKRFPGHEVLELSVASHGALG